VCGELETNLTERIAEAANGAGSARSPEAYLLTR
jgi:hypothetical protein